VKLDPLKGLALLEFGGHTFRFTTDLKSDTIYMEIDGKMIECHPRELMTLHQAITFSLACMDPDYAQQVIKFDPAAAPDSDVF
jgi:hypothetical protein